MGSVCTSNWGQWKAFLNVNAILNTICCCYTPTNTHTRTHTHALASHILQNLWPSSSSSSNDSKSEAPQKEASAEDDHRVAHRNDNADDDAAMMLLKTRWSKFPICKVTTTHSRHNKKITKRGVWNVNHMQICWESRFSLLTSFHFCAKNVCVCCVCVCVHKFQCFITII